MTTKKTTLQAAAPTFDPDRLYKVQVNRVVKAAGLTIRPRTGGVISGAIAEDNKEAIISFEPVEN